MRIQIAPGAGTPASNESGSPHDAPVGAVERGREAGGILDHFALRKHFAAVAGPGLDGSRRHKADVITDALTELALPADSGVVMIGDRNYDVTGAHRAGLPCIGVAWGYGSAAELRAAGAVAVASTVGELERLLVRSGPVGAG